MNTYKHDDIYNGYNYYDSDDYYDEEEEDHYEPVPVDLDQLVELYSDEFAKFDARVYRHLDGLRIIRKTYEVGRACDEHTLQKQLELLMLGAQIEKNQNRKPINRRISWLQV